MTTETVFVLAIEKLRPAVLAKLESGQARIINGVVRSTNGSRILQHLPLRPEALEEMESLLPAARNICQKLPISAGLALSLSTVAVMGAVVACTAYLARKLDRIQKSLDLLERELQGQNLLFYAERTTGYFGAVESLRETLSSPELIAENTDMIVHKLAQLGTLRCELYSLIDNLPSISEQFTPHHQSLALDFTLETLDLLPKGAFIEIVASNKIARNRLGDSIRDSTKKKHKRSLELLRSWGNRHIRAVALGRSDITASNLASRVDTIRGLTSSEENNLLLTHSI